MKKYKQLSQEQRYIIERMKTEGFLQKDIAKSLGVHESTISRELRRNVNKRGMHALIYNGERAHKKARERIDTKPKKLRFTEDMLDYMRQKLKVERWSPEYISERGKLELGDFVSHESIYKYIWECKHSNRRGLGQDKDLHRYLKHHGRRKKRRNSKGNRGCIPNRKPISDRPKVVEERKRIGDFEVDIMIGKDRKPGLIVLTDRKSAFTKLIKVETKKAKIVANKIIERMNKSNIKLKTMTFDNDLAFAEHERIANKLFIKTYFTRPYTSQDKGSVENRIGVIRRFFPKGSDMSNVHPNTIKAVERKLNNRPLRKFGYLTPYEKLNKINLVALTA